ncbi:hypothetical protein KSP39_PZI010228 [Platanthera zijinensis]|uniref:Uncharacterized protein n=1 Tax=Platanthera zijinensis TaxID=2320716 RepID=A0AAP0BK99_9ASPA
MMMKTLNLMYSAQRVDGSQQSSSSQMREIVVIFNSSLTDPCELLRARKFASKEGASFGMCENRTRAHARKLEESSMRGSVAVRIGKFENCLGSVVELSPKFLLFPFLFQWGVAYRVSGEEDEKIALAPPVPLFTVVQKLPPDPPVSAALPAPFSPNRLLSHPLQPPPPLFHRHDRHLCCLLPPKFATAALLSWNHLQTPSPTKFCPDLCSPAWIQPSLHLNPIHRPLHLQISATLTTSFPVTTALLGVPPITSYAIPASIGLVPSMFST